MKAAREALSRATALGLDDGDKRRGGHFRRKRRRPESE